MSNPKNAIAKQAGLEDLAKEDTISIDIVSVDAPIGKHYISDFITNILIGTNQPQSTDLLNDLIENNAPPTTPNPYFTFMILYNEAKKMTGGGKGYLTALQMHYGLTDNRPCILYQPVGLVRATDIINKKGNYAIKESGLYFMYDKSKKEFLPQADTNPIDTYKGTISVRRDGTNFFPYKEKVDTKQAIFAFQEIFAVLHDNGDPYEIKISNAARSFTEETPVITRHTLMLGPSNLYPWKDLKGVYADLAHLCPPHCTPNLLTIEQE